LFIQKKYLKIPWHLYPNNTTFATLIDSDDIFVILLIIRLLLAIIQIPFDVSLSI